VITKDFLVDYAVGVYQHITNPVEIGSLIDEGLERGIDLRKIGCCWRWRRRIDHDRWGRWTASTAASATAYKDRKS
jgi:hypothetical protein